MGERLDRAIRATVVGGGLLGLLAIVAVASGRGHPGISGTTDIDAVAGVRDVVLTVGVTIYVFVLAFVVWALWGTRLRGGNLDRRSGAGSVLVFFLVSLAFYWGVHNRVPPQRETDELPLGPGQVLVQPQAPEPGAATKPIPATQFRWPLAAGLAVGGAAVIGAVLLLRRRPDGDGELDPLSKRQLAAIDLAAVVEGTLDDLRREADPRRAVIAAYAQMERVLARHGLPRNPAEAPFEYLGRMLAGLQVRPGAALALTELFERARFSDHEIDGAMKDEAIDALVSVRDDLRAL